MHENVIYAVLLHLLRSLIHREYWNTDFRRFPPIRLIPRFLPDDDRNSCRVPFGYIAYFTSTSVITGTVYSLVLSCLFEDITSNPMLVDSRVLNLFTTSSDKNCSVALCKKSVNRDQGEQKMKLNHKFITHHSWTDSIGFTLQGFVYRTWQIQDQYLHFWMFPYIICPCYSSAVRTVHIAGQPKTNMDKEATF